MKVCMSTTDKLCPCWSHTRGLLRCTNTVNDFLQLLKCQNIFCLSLSHSVFMKCSNLSPWLFMQEGSKYSSSDQWWICFQMQSLSYKLCILAPTLWHHYLSVLLHWTRQLSLCLEVLWPGGPVAIEQLIGHTAPRYGWIETIIFFRGCQYCWVYGNFRVQEHS